VSDQLCSRKFFFFYLSLYLVHWCFDTVSRVVCAVVACSSLRCVQVINSAGKTYYMSAGDVNTFHCVN